jgi:hypothetical protein
MVAGLPKQRAVGSLGAAFIGVFINTILKIPTKVLQDFVGIFYLGMI